MTGEERREQILNIIKSSDIPVSGATLAKRFDISRQVIVQDIALLRASNYDIYSTPKGYLINENEQSSVSKPSRVFCVSHTDEQIEDELNTFVDMGGRVLDVYIEHELYGSIKAPLPISCRRQVKEFMEEIKSGKSRPLKNLSSGSIHYHTVEADSEQILDMIENELKEKKYLIEKVS